MGKINVTASQMYTMRQLIKEGWTPKKIAEHLGTTSSVVCSYTKAERATMKELIRMEEKMLGA